MTECFHASKTPLEPGTVLEARFIRPEVIYQFDAVESALAESPEMRATILKAILLADIVQNSGKSYLAFAVKESILEHVRSTDFPKRPSRYKAVFTAPTKRDSARFRDLTRVSSDRPHLHTCVIDGEAFTGDLRYVVSLDPFLPMLEQVEYVMERARLYWNGQRSDAPILEYLAEPGAVTITAACDW